MKATLFVDESGDFSGDRARWIVAGVLVPWDPAEAEAAVRAATVSRLLPLGISAPGEVHLTELRKAGRAMNVADAVLGSLASIPGVVVGAVQNHGGVTVGDRTGPRATYERTYRLMLLDLVALLEADRRDGAAVTQLHLEIATRTADGQRMTTFGELEDDVMRQMAGAVEAGLASRGLLDASSAQRLTLTPARHRWGLAAADVVANLTRHAGRPGPDARLRERYEAALGFRSFEALGSYATRRARVAERDGDLPLALARWAGLVPKKSEERREQAESIRRLVGAVISLRDGYGARIALESTLDKLAHTLASPEALGAALRRIEENLAGAPGGAALQLLFRLRSFSRDAAHRRADSAEGRRLDGLQAGARLAVASDPEGFGLVLDDDVRVANLYVQELDFEGALASARSHAQRVAHYGAVWELLGDAGTEHPFRATRLHARASQALSRALLFAAPLDESVSDARVHEAATLLQDLSRPETAEDRSRLQNDLILAAIRTGDGRGALELAYGSGDSPSAYDHYAACRAACTALLDDRERSHDAAVAVYVRACADEEAFKRRVNPLQLAWRERALLAHLLGDRKGALDALREASERTAGLGGDAPLKRWLALVLSVYRDHVRSHEELPSTHARVDSGERGHASLIEHADALVKAGAHSPLQAVRATTPY